MPNITLDLKVENHYEDGYDQTNTCEAVSVPTPPASTETDPNRDDWASDHLFEFTGTGTGRENMDAYYTVTVTATSDPDALATGSVFEFGG